MEKMSRADRAKQFMPFSALKGFEELVKNEQRMISSKRELSEEDVFSISKTLSSIKKRMMVRVTYYDTDAYLETEGLVSSIDFVFKKIVVVRTEIPFENISNIEIKKY